MRINKKSLRTGVCMNSLPFGAFHEPARLPNRSEPLESGAEDARTPDAATAMVSEPREAFGVRPIYRRSCSGLDFQPSQVPMYSKNEKVVLRAAALRGEEVKAR